MMEIQTIISIICGGIMIYKLNYRVNEWDTVELCVNVSVYIKVLFLLLLFSYCHVMYSSGVAQTSCCYEQKFSLTYGNVYGSE